MKYSIKQAADKSFASKRDLVTFIKKNRDDLFGIKRLELKTSAPGLITNLEYKGFSPEINVSSDIIEVKTVNNTTNIIDSHMDLHLPSLWNKTVKENPYNPHLNSHKLDFDYLICKKAKQTLETFTFAQLGLASAMQTEANCHTFILKRSFNEKMFDRYAEGIVTEHSVAMRYVHLYIAFYDEDDVKEMNFFNENKAKAVNPEIADENGYFWVVTEARKSEASAVVLGSNSVTPTLYVKNYDPETSAYKEQPPSGTVKKQPAQATVDNEEFATYLNNTQFIKL